MDTVTFGEFLRLTDERLAAAEATPLPAEPDIAGEVHELRRVVAGMLGYLRDITPGQHAEVIALTAKSWWQRAAVDLREGLQLAADSLDYAAAGLGEPDPEADNVRVHCLAGAADALSAGRDLLNSHFFIGKDGTRVARTDWAHVLEAPRTVRTLTEELARWPRRVALFAEQLALESAPIDDATRAALTSSGRWLRRADMLFRDPHESVADRADRSLLYGIPLATMPERVAPQSAEPDAVLCSEIEVSAERLRRIAFGLPERARWSTEISGYAWEQAATAGAIICDLARLTLQTLGERSGGPGDPGQLTAAAAAADLAHHAWRQAASTWKVMATDSASGSPAVAETSVLMLRMGRLVTEDPEWTPARHRYTRLRDSTGLAPDSARFGTVLAAIHHAVDALARMARADLAAINTAPGRLYALTKSLPARHDVPRKYAEVPTGRIKTVREVYQIALGATERAALYLDDLVTATSAPSRTLALARSVAPINCDTRALDGDDALALCTETLDKSLRPKEHVLGTKHRQDIDPQALICAYAEEGKTLKECAALFGVSSTTIAAILEEQGIARRRPGPARTLGEPASGSGTADVTEVNGADVIPKLEPRPGAVTATVSALGADDPSVLLRAAALDNATAQFVEQLSREPETPAKDRRSRKRTAARLAATDIPRPAAQEPLAPAAPQPRTRSTERPARRTHGRSA